MSRSICRAVGIALAWGIALAACKGDGGGPGPAPERAASFITPPKIYITSRLDKCQRAAVRAALAWWSEVDGVRLYGAIVPPEAPQALIEAPGTIVVTNEPPTRPGALATTTTWRDGDVMIAARVALGSNCDPSVAAHELGHALGWIDHAGGDGWLMSNPIGSWRHPM